MVKRIGLVMACRRWWASVAAALILLTVGCAPAPEKIATANVVGALSGEADVGFARAYAPLAFTFPRDHGAHPEFRTEWWYFTGNLMDAQGDEYGFQFTIFRSALSAQVVERESDLATNQVYMAHLAVTDGAAGEHVSFERFSRGSGGLAGAEGEPRFRVWLEDWSAEQEAPGVMRISAAAPGEGDSPAAGLDLRLVETRPVVLQGDAGLSQKGPEPGNASYYYSLVGLETSGSVSIGGRTVAVTGRSWMDHEFGTSALSEDAVGWDWYSVQLDSGTVLMLAQIRTGDGRSAFDFHGALVTADGTKTLIPATSFTVEVTGEWTSPRTGIVYPSGWRVGLPDHGLALAITPLVRDQEMDVSYLYWEGAVTVTGTEQGKPVTGRGYVELTGYGSTGGYQR